MSHAELPVVFRAEGVAWKDERKSNGSAVPLPRVPWRNGLSRFFVAAALIIIPLVIFFMVESLDLLTTKNLNTADVVVMLILAGLVVTRS
jgi:hypothetical protein